MNAELKKVFMIHASSDTCEGRTSHIIIGFAISKQLADILAKNKGPYGSSADVDEYEALVVERNGKQMIPIMKPWNPIQWFELDTENKEYAEQIEAMRWVMELSGNSVSSKDAEEKLKTISKIRIQDIVEFYRKANQIGHNV